MSAWPDEKFDRLRDSANYSCVSTNNSVGPGVRSSTYFGVEYPPENATVSLPVVAVVEGLVPQQVLCTATAFPGKENEDYMPWEASTNASKLFMVSEADRQSIS